jgi:hypothetical protein
LILLTWYVAKICLTYTLTCFESTWSRRMTVMSFFILILFWSSWNVDVDWDWDACFDDSIMTKRRRDDEKWIKEDWVKKDVKKQLRINLICESTIFKCVLSTSLDCKRRRLIDEKDLISTTNRSDRERDFDSTIS